MFWLSGPLRFSAISAEFQSTAEHNWEGPPSVQDVQMAKMPHIGEACDDPSAWDCILYNIIYSVYKLGRESRHMCMTHLCALPCIPGLDVQLK